jgi:hypothetical protein
VNLARHAPFSERTNAMLKSRRLFIGSAAVTLLAAVRPALSQGAGDLPASARLAAPGPMHQPFAQLVGDWRCEMLVYPGVGIAPITSTDLTARRELTLGGRYLREELTGVFAGNPANRVGMLGYNALDERYEFATFDTFEPGLMLYHGHRTNSGALDLRGESTEAGLGPKPTGRKRVLRFEWSMSPEGSVQKIFAKYPAEPEALFVEQRYVRKG